MRKTFLAISIWLTCMGCGHQPEPTPPPTPQPPPQMELQADLKLMDDLSEAFADPEKAFAKAKKMAVMVQLDLFTTQLEIFKLDTGRYPTSSEGFAALHVNPGIDEWNGPYTKNVIPIDPWGNGYVYISMDDGSYLIYSIGPDGVEHTVDDVRQNE